MILFSESNQNENEQIRSIDTFLEDLGKRQLTFLANESFIRCFFPTGTTVLESLLNPKLGFSEKTISSIIIIEYLLNVQQTDY